jgi:hypothetical protein
MPSVLACHMLPTNKLETLKTAAASSDWSSAGEVFIDLGLDANTAADRFQVEALAPNALNRPDGSSTGPVGRGFSLRARRNVEGKLAQHRI